MKVSHADTPGKDELFVLEDSQPQFKLKSKVTGFYASTRRGLEIHCNQVDAQDPELFQLEMNADTKKVSFNLLETSKYHSMKTSTPHHRNFISVISYSKHYDVSF